MKNNDINYQVKLIDDSHYLEEKMNLLLNLKKEYNRKTPVNFIRNFIYSPKAEMLKYGSEIKRYIKKLDAVNSKFELFQKSYEGYINERTQGHYESLKAHYKDIKSRSIDYPKYNPYI